MEHHHIRAHLRIPEIGVEAPELIACRERLVDDRARRQADHVEIVNLLLDLRLHAVERARQILARDHPLAHHHLEHVAPRQQRVLPEGRLVDRDVAEPERREPVAPEDALHLAPVVREIARLADREEHHPDGELVSRRQVRPGDQEPLEEQRIHAEEEPRAVARVVDRSAAVLHASEPPERHVDERARRAAREIRDRSHAATAAARVFLESREDRGCAARHGRRMDGVTLCVNAPQQPGGRERSFAGVANDTR